MKANAKHPNKFFHNWLIYKIGDRFLDEHKSYIRGELIDLGCGEAPYKEYLLQFADSYIGVDWTDSLHNSQADIVSDLNSKIEIEDSSADTLLSIGVLEHLNEPQQFLFEAYRVLRTGGTIIMQTPWQWQVHEAPNDYFRYSPYGLKYLLTKAGFKNILIKPQCGFFSAAALKINYATARMVHGLPNILMYPFATALLPFWTLSQICGPILDKLDKDWERETTGFSTIATK